MKKILLTLLIAVTVIGCATRKPAIPAFRVGREVS